MTGEPTEQKPAPSLKALAEQITKTREQVFEAQGIVHLGVHAFHSNYGDGVSLDLAVPAFELLYRHLDGVAGQLGELVDDIRIG